MPITGDVFQTLCTIIVAKKIVQNVKIDKWLVKSGVYVLCAFALQWTHKTFWSSIYDYSLVILRVEYLKKKKMKSKWVNGANAGWKSHAFVQSNSKLIFGVCIGQWH